MNEYLHIVQVININLLYVIKVMMGQLTYIMILLGAILVCL